MDWKHLTELSQGATFVVERVRLPDTGIAIEGAFELPALARLAQDDQVFVVAFVRSHGSIKEMERLFGVSYPTIKARLNRLAESLGAALNIEAPEGDDDPAPERRAVLARLERGEISVRDALAELAR
jgi:hypothetical protein